MSKRYYLIMSILIGVLCIKNVILKEWFLAIIDTICLILYIITYSKCEKED